VQGDLIQMNKDPHQSSGARKANAHENNCEMEIVCNVCGRKYTFDSSEIASLI
jgi:hypothetical protein